MTGQAVPSIHRRVLVWVMAALVTGASLLVASTYLSMKSELSEVFEDNLKQVALAVANHHSQYGISRVPRLVDQLPRIYEEYGEFDFVTAVWSRGGALTHTSDASVALPFLSRSGLSRVNIEGRNGTSTRLFWRTASSRLHSVAVRARRWPAKAPSGWLCRQSRCWVFWPCC